MKRLGIVVFALTLVLATHGGAVSESTSSEVASPTVVTNLSGSGLWSGLACAGCLGSGMVLMTGGWGSLWTAALSARGGALASACVEACVQAI